MSENNLMVDMKQKLLLTPDLTFIINEIQQTDGKKPVRHEEQTFNIYTKTKTTLGPCKQDLVICLCASKTFELANIIGIIELFNFFEQNSGVFVASSLNRVHDKNQVQISFLNTNSHEATIPAGTKVAVFNFAGTEIHYKEKHKYLSNSNNNLLVRSIIILILCKIEKKTYFTQP